MSTTEPGEISRPVDGSGKGMKKPNGYYKNWKNCERELLDAITQLGHYPTRKELIGLGLASLATSLVLYHGGLVNAQNRLPKTRPNGYWQKWDNVEREFRLVVRELGHFPTQDELKNLEKSSLAFAASEYHGGLHAVRIRMGLPNHSREHPKGYWKQWSNIEPTLREVMEHLGHFPSHTELKAAGHAYLGDAIRRNHGGMAKARVRLEAPEVTQQGHWSSWETCAAKLQELIAQTGTFPSSKWLAANGHGGLADAITKRHGGYRKARERLGYVRDVKPNGYWHTWGNVEKELRLVMKTLGRFPNAQDLNRLGQHSLSYAISKHHDGFIAVRARMGQRRVSNELVARYAVELMECYRRAADDQSTFESFLDQVATTCETEADLLTFIQGAS